MQIFYFLAVLLGPLVKLLYSFIGNYAGTMVVATIVIKLVLFPLSIHQQKSTAKMAVFQPLMQEIQQKYKNNQQKQQEELLKLQQEHGFNPMAGCLPMLIQLPIFILLYSSLMSPQFISMAGQSNFLFINRLDATLKGNAGVSNDGKFSVSPNDKFTVGKKIKFYAGNEELGEIKLKKNNVDVLG